VANSQTGARAAPAISAMDLRHLRRETRTALELAVVAIAPAKLIERLALSAGLLETLTELPVDSPPSLALLPRFLPRTQEALDEWQRWQAAHLKVARG
jgi:hypothetical protein